MTRLDETRVEKGYEVALEAVAVSKSGKTRGVQDPWAVGCGYVLMSCDSFAVSVGVWGMSYTKI